MAKEGKKALVPKLRFPEFSGSIEWKAKRMDSLYSFMRNNTLSRDKLNYEAGTAKNIHYGDIHTKFSTLFDITKERVPFINVTEELPDTDSDDYCVQGDLVFADSSEDTNDVGKCIEIVRLDKQHLLAGQHTILARQRNGEFVIGFGGRVFQSARVRSQIQHEAQGTKVYAISPTRLARIEVAYPSDKDEQQKIADCLSSLDELIAAQGRKVEALNTYKRGLMQQLFPREGETLPRLRFPKFRDAPEWSETPLGDLVDLLSGYPFDGTDIAEDRAGIPLMRGINVTEGSIRHNREIDRYYLGPLDGLEKYRLKQNDLVIGMDGSKVGKNSALITEADADSLLIQRVARLRATSVSAISFIFQQIHSPRFHAYVDRINTSSGIPHISAKQIKEYPIHSAGEEEQQRVAELLSFVDIQVVAETDKLESLKDHKKGLMQQLFPSLEEV